ncbi:hypothetical protein AQUCO_03800010v1 [Aquilegia coerulea]|uniref:Tafazzin family protein n=1 Tax=Aquilegia coerulea TaxID=218851 RepID=A0A2G5CS65_AQUCA|nr:hypothetical protein AQUCO_03800010v1 [Aquilegia coerulea]
MVWRMEWAARADHLGGIPRNLVIKGVGVISKLMTTLLNTTTVHNSETLLHLVRSRPPGTPLITVSNHMSTLDDPLMWGFKGFPTGDAKLARWVLAAEDICFKNSIYSYFFRLGKCIPITRGGGIYQDHMNEAIERLRDGEWMRQHKDGSTPTFQKESGLPWKVYVVYLQHFQLLSLASGKAYRETVRLLIMLFVVGDN